MQTKQPFDLVVISYGPTCAGYRCSHDSCIAYASTPPSAVVEWQQATPELVQCGGCGLVGLSEHNGGSIGFHSGSYECPRCWSWRKLDGPAARHWEKVSAEFLSNVDMYDWMHYLPAAVGDDFGVMLKKAQHLHWYSKGMILMQQMHLPYQGPRPE